MPLVRQYVKQTNHCKLTMVWCEDDISFLFALLQRSRDDWRDHVTVCSVITFKAFGGEAVVLEGKIIVMVSCSR